MDLSNMLKLIYFVLLQVVDTLNQISSAVAVTNIVEVTLVRLDQRLCKHIEPPVLPKLMWCLCSTLLRRFAHHLKPLWKPYLSTVTRPCPILTTISNAACIKRRE